MNGRRDSDRIHQVDGFFIGNPEDPGQLSESVIFEKEQTATVQFNVQPVGGKTQEAKAKEEEAFLQFGRDMTKEAREGRLDPVVGRDREIDRIIQILSRRDGFRKCSSTEGTSMYEAGSTNPASVILKDRGRMALLLSARTCARREREWRGVPAGLAALKKSGPVPQGYWEGCAQMFAATQFICT